MTGNTPEIKRALISVSDKTGLLELAAKLHSLKVEIISSGGTGKFLQDNGIPYTPIEKVTGNPECFAGRMKTLGFQVSSALLFRRDNASDIKQAEELGIKPIDLVVCNLYPFEEVAKRPHSWDELVENIDIGGPTMIRAAAKNHARVGVVVEPVEEVRIAQCAVLDHFGQTSAQFAWRQGRQRAGIDDDSARWMEGADQVLAGGDVHRGLPADR